MLILKLGPLNQTRGEFGLTFLAEEQQAKNIVFLRTVVLCVCVCVRAERKWAEPSWMMSSHTRKPL